MILYLKFYFLFEISNLTALLVSVAANCPENQFLNPITSECVLCSQDEIHRLVCNLYIILSFDIYMFFYKGSLNNGDELMIMITKTYISQCLWMLMDFKITLANVRTSAFMLTRSGQMNSINHIVDAIPGSLQITTMTLFHQCGNCLLENFILIKPQIKPQLSWQFKSAYCGLRLSIGI